MDFGVVFLSFLMLESMLLWIFKAYLVFIEELLKNGFVGNWVVRKNADSSVCVELVLNISLELIPLASLLLGNRKVDVFSVGSINVGITFDELVHLLSIILLGVVLLG